jgi:hypothetical protein
MAYDIEALCKRIVSRVYVTMNTVIRVLHDISGLQSMLLNVRHITLLVI